MLNDSSSLPGVLYVDDEEQSLKYFQRALDDSFRIFTAPSADEGFEIMRREAHRITIVVSDQRMPGMNGADFLGRIREEYPHAIRILTTAYSDTQSAIEAVNLGHIYQYITKPWELDDLAQRLRRAVDYHHVLSERDHLLTLKMTTLQRILCSDRLKWLLIHSRSLSERKQAAFRRALTAFVKAMPVSADPFAALDGGLHKRNFEIGNLIRNEYLNASRCLDLLNSWSAASLAPSLPESLTASLAALAEADRGEVWSVPESLRNFLSALLGTPGLSADEVVLEHGPDLRLRLTLRPADPSFDPERLARALFGLLAQRETPELSVLFFEVLLALSIAGGSLAWSIVLPAAADPPVSLTFVPGGEGDDVDGIIAELYEKFSTADISALSTGKP